MAVAEPLSGFADDLLDEHTDLAVEAPGSMMVVGGAIGAGANFNVVPGAAWFSVDWRFNPERTLEAELARLHEQIEQRPATHGGQRRDPAAAARRARRRPTTRRPPRSPSASRRSTARPAFELCPGVLDTRWYAQLGVPAFAYGGGRLDISHGPDEYIAEDAMRRCAEVYARFAARYYGHQARSSRAPLDRDARSEREGADVVGLHVGKQAREHERHRRGTEIARVVERVDRGLHRALRPALLLEHARHRLEDARAAGMDGEGGRLGRFARASSRAARRRARRGSRTPGGNRSRGAGTSGRSSGRARGRVTSAACPGCRGRATCRWRGRPTRLRARG